MTFRSIVQRFYRAINLYINANSLEADASLYPLKKSRSTDAFSVYGPEIIRWLWISRGVYLLSHTCEYAKLQVITMQITSNAPSYSTLLHTSNY